MLSKDFYLQLLFAEASNDGLVVTGAALHMPH